jgi:hypothetical protein
MKHITAILTIASTISCIAFLILLPISLRSHLPTPATHGNEIEPNASFSIGTFHCGISRGAIWFFNDDMAYTGSIIRLEGMWAGKHTVDRTDWRWVVNRYGVDQVSHIDEMGQCAGKDRGCDLPGIYYRYFEWWNQKDSWWTLAFSMWYPIALSAVLPSFWLIRRLYRRLRRYSSP